MQRCNNPYTAQQHHQADNDFTKNDTSIATDNISNIQTTPSTTTQEYSNVEQKDKNTF